MRLAAIALAVLMILALPAVYGVRSFIKSLPNSHGASAPHLSEGLSRDFSAFAQRWKRHGMAVTIDSSGHGDASWRVYRWCSDDPVPPCDAQSGNQVINGGRATLIFARIEGSTAYGQVNNSSDSRALPDGPVSITLLPYDMARLDPPGIILCGAHFQDQAPAETVRSQPCGA